MFGTEKQSCDVFLGNDQHSLASQRVSTPCRVMNLTRRNNQQPSASPLDNFTCNSDKISIY